MTSSASWRVDISAAALAKRWGPTAFVHEVCLRFAQRSSSDLLDRNHLVALAARAMRMVIVDHWRRKQARKRDPQAPVSASIDDVAAAPDALPPIDILALDEALRRLSELDARQAQVVELRDATEPSAALPEEIPFELIETAFDDIADDPSDLRLETGYYKVPSLRGVWYRGPFEHNGYGLKTRPVPGHRFGLDLSAEDKQALIAFLKAL